MTYEYLCMACSHAWEAEQPISAAPLKKCPKCKKNRAKRQISGGTGFLLKGGGWYADGYGSAGATGAKGKTDAKPKTDAASAAEPAKDSKGAAKDSESKTPAGGSTAKPSSGTAAA